MKYHLAVLGVIAALAFIPLQSYAQEIEHGKNFDRELIGVDESGLYKYVWTSTPERILVDHVWKNYMLTEDDTNIKIETANGAINFNKDSCSLRFYDRGFIQSGETPIINSVTNTIKKASAQSDEWFLSPVNSSQCNTTVKPFDDSIRIEADKSIPLGSGFKTIYDVRYDGVIKITYQYYNGDLGDYNTKFGIVQSFDGSFKVRVGGMQYDTSTIQDTILITKEQLEKKTITIEKNGLTITYDPQNYIHQRLWALKISPNHINFDFTNAIDTTDIGTILEIDPTFGYSAGTHKSEKSLAGTCTTWTSVSPTTGAVGTDGAVNSCYYDSLEWDTSSIPDYGVITDTKTRYDTQVGGGSDPITCNAVSLAFQPSTRTDAQVMADVIAGATYVDLGCTTGSATDTVVDLGTTADTDLKNRLSANWFAYGIIRSPNALAAIKYADFDTVELQVTYLSTAPPRPSSFTATSQARQVDFTWTMSYGGNVTKFYIGRSLDNSTWPAANKTLINANVTTTHSYDYWRINQLYYVNLTASNGINSTAKFSSFTTDTFPSVPLNPYTTGQSDTSIKINWSPSSSSGGDTISGYRIDYCITCTAWTNLVNNTNTLNYNQTGLTGSPTVKYRMAAWNGVGLSPYTANFTGSPFRTTTGTLTLSSGVVGDTIQINSTVSITQASPSPVTVSQLKLYRNGTLVETKATSVQVASGSSSSNFDPFWNRMLTGSQYSFKMYATVSNATGTVTLASSNLTSSREYDPLYFNALSDPATEGQVNYTVQRVNDEDSIHLQVNRQGGSLGSTWEINCITQTNTEAAATRNQSLNWPGTWINYSTTGYFNGTWNDLANTHGYITCFNPPGILFTTTSYTNSSLALFGIEIFDNSYGAMLGVPVGIFFLAMAGSMANKRTAPTWIIVVLAMAGTMAAIGFFTVNPLVWGLALVTGLLGVLVNQKVF